MKYLPLLLALTSTTVWAHKPSDSYLQLNAQGSEIRGQWEVSLRDLHAWLGVDADGNGEITWGELKSARGRIEQGLSARLELRSGGTGCPMAFTGMQVSEHGGATFAALALEAHCAAPVETLRVQYQLLFDRDPTHRGLLKLESGARAARLVVFSPETATQDFVLKDSGGWRSLGQHVREGAWHVWSGLDHVLFLAALLLPAVVRREAGRWVAAESARRAFTEIFIVVTAFTLAHAATLTLVLLEQIELSSRWVESLVALTVAFAAFNNLRPLVRRRLWLVSFGFGLIHGAAIASVLAALDLARSSLALALLGFNLGVEGGQLAIVALWLPLGFLLRRKAWYQWGVVMGGSAAVLLVALVWLAERALDLKLTG